MKRLKPIIGMATVGATILAFSAATSASVIDSHIGISVTNGQLTTEGWDSSLDGAAQYQGEQRVFVQEFDPFTFFTDDPGTNSVGGTFATPGAIGFNFLDALQVWNGNGFSATDHTMSMSFGPGGALFAETGDGFVEGFATDVRDENSHPDNPSQWGRHHIHHNFELHSPDENDPMAGIYLVSLKLWYQAGEDNDVMYDDSKPFWLLMGLGQSEGDLMLARDWVEQNIVPAPGAMALLALAGLAGARRRRR